MGKNLGDKSMEIKKWKQTYKIKKEDFEFEDAVFKAMIKRGLSLPWWKKAPLYKRIWKRIKIYLGFQKPDVF